MGGHQILLSRDPVPRASVILFSVFTHIVVLALSVLLWPRTGPHILPEKFAAVQKLSGTAALSFNAGNPTPSRPHASPLHSPRRTQRTRVSQAEADGASAAQILREHAKQGTAAIMLSLKFRQTYGFSPTHDYQLAFRMAGEIPPIPAADLPPRFEQYVTVEVTIDVDGRVADERIVAGLVNPEIEQKLLSAIREFKYSPAKRDGVPIPSQLDIIIHIPS